MSSTLKDSITSKRRKKEEKGSCSSHPAAVAQ
jgi:hypothetical protein